MDFRFEYADKSQMNEILPRLFELLYANMSVIAPTGNSYEADYEMWFSNVYPAMEKPQRQIVLMYFRERVVGYFQYYVNAGVFMMEEIQIQKEYHGTGIFSAFYTWLIARLPSDIQTVEAYSDKQNFKSQGVLEYLGLKKIGENKNGKSFHYKGDYQNLLDRYR